MENRDEVGNFLKNTQTAKIDSNVTGNMKRELSASGRDIRELPPRLQTKMVSLEAVSISHSKKK